MSGLTNYGKLLNFSHNNIDNEEEFLSLLNDTSNNDVHMLLRSLYKRNNYRYFNLTLNNYNIDNLVKITLLNLFIRDKNISYFVNLFNITKITMTELNDFLWYSNFANNLNLAVFLVNNHADINSIRKDEFKSKIINEIRTQKLKQLLK